MAEKLERIIFKDDLKRIKDTVEREPWLKHSTVDGQSSVHMAANWGSMAILTWLVQTGESPNARYRGVPALHAALTSGHLDAATFLVENKADLKTRSSGLDALDHAIAYHDEDAVAMLLDHGASLDTQYGCYGGWKKVHGAVYTLDADVLDAILRRGGDPFVRVAPCPTYECPYVTCTPRGILSKRSRAGKTAREKARRVLRVLTRWENFHMHQRVWPILRVRAAVQIDPYGRMAMNRVMQGRSLPTVAFTSCPEGYTHSSPDVPRVSRESASVDTSPAWRNTEVFKTDGAVRTPATARRLDMMRPLKMVKLLRPVVDDCDEKGSMSKDYDWRSDVRTRGAMRRILAEDMCVLATPPGSRYVVGCDDRAVGDDRGHSQMVGVVQRLCLVSDELLQHVVSFIVTPVPP